MIYENYKLNKHGNKVRIYENIQNIKWIYQNPYIFYLQRIHEQKFNGDHCTHLFAICNYYDECSQEQSNESIFLLTDIIYEERGYRYLNVLLNEYTMYNVTRLEQVSRHIFSQVPVTRNMKYFGLEQGKCFGVATGSYTHIYIYMKLSNNMAVLPYKVVKFNYYASDYTTI